MAKHPISPIAAKILRKQLKKFRKKFGRDPGPNDPVFFDPDADEPRQMDPNAVGDMVVEAMRKSGAQPAIIYAYKKTGRLLRSDLLHQYPPEAIAEWEAAIDEYYAMEEGRKPKD